jgi:hypothetical protein
MPTRGLVDPYAQFARHAIKGLRLSSIVGGQRQFFLKADAFAIHKKKLGYLKIGLLNEARFEGVLLRLYGNDRLVENPEDKRGIPGPSFELPDLTAGFNKEGGPLAVLPGGRLSGIVMRPVIVELYHDDDLLTKITADKAYLRVRNRQIVFEGQVRMASRDRWLTTRRLSLAPQTALVSVMTAYRRSHAGQVEEGRSLQTDLCLNPQNPPGKNTKNKT